jgi:signal transduction histidine kinase
MFSRIFFSQSDTDRVINTIVFLLILISGIYIIKSIIQEVSLREKDDKLVDDVTILNKKLKKTNIKLKELDAKKSEFMSLATHQLRAPLTAMRGYSSMILDGTFGHVDNIEIEDAIDKIARSTTDLTTIVEDYLNISRIEQGKMQYIFSIFDLKDLVDSVIKEVKITIDRSGLILTLHYDKSLSFKISADEGKIKQVVFNLIDNSVKYTKEGTVDIYLTKKPNNKVLFKIQDTGVGIKPEVLPKLFNKFTRAPDASETNILGTGLGLYVASEIMKAHSGRVWAESEGQGKGSQFYMELNSIN